MKILASKTARATVSAWASSRSCQDCCSLCFLVVMCSAQYGARARCKDPLAARQPRPSVSTVVPDHFLVVADKELVVPGNFALSGPMLAASMHWLAPSRVELAHAAYLRINVWTLRGGMRTGVFVSSYSGSDLLLKSFLVAGILRSYDC